MPKQPSQLADVTTAAPHITFPQLSDAGQRQILAETRLDPLAENLFIAWAASFSNCTIAEGEAQYQILLPDMPDCRPGPYWISVATMIEQQALRIENGETITVRQADQLGPYRQDDMLPRYLFAAWTAFKNHTSLVRYTNRNKLDNSVLIGSYWRWIAQQIRREFNVVDNDKYDRLATFLAVAFSSDYFHTTWATAMKNHRANMRGDRPSNYWRSIALMVQTGIEAHTGTFLADNPTDPLYDSLPKQLCWATWAANGHHSFAKAQKDCPKSWLEENGSFWLDIAWEIRQTVFSDLQPLVDRFIGQK